MKTKILLLFLFCTFIVWGQEKKASDADRKEAEKIFTGLKDVYSKHLGSYKKANEKLQELKKNLSGKSDEKDLMQIQENYKLANAYNDTLAVRHQLFLSYKDVYKDKGITEIDIDKWYGYTHEVFYKSGSITTTGTDKPKESDYIITQDNLKNAIQKVMDANKDHEAKIGIIKLLEVAPKYNNEYWETHKKACIVKIKTKSFANRVLGFKTRQKVFDQIILENKTAECICKENPLHCNSCASENTDSKAHICVKLKIKNIKIDSVKLDINEGLIEYVKVFYDNGQYFYNKKAPIPIQELERRGGDRLYNVVGDDYVYLKDILIFDYDKRFNFLPDDGTFTLDQKNKTKTLYKNTNVNSLVSFTAFSDLLGLLGDQANSLISFEGKAKFYLHRKNFANTYLYLLPSIQPSFHYNKLDSKFDSVTINPDDKVINAVEMYRRNAYSVGIDLSLFRWDWRPSNSLEIKAGYSYASTLSTF
ncbi:hypothetical protein, partial [Chryseobacterium artocarpi]|uniref:hypothetical protein n=1 Tax=Chryseobacterium artocarpi TaxID=1414727 RepID=UPI003F2D2FFF